MDVRPEQTSIPTHKRRRVATSRQIITDLPQVEQAALQCEDVGNVVISCFPTADTVIPQEEWASFVCTSSYSSLSIPFHR